MAIGFVGWWQLAATTPTTGVHWRAIAEKLMPVCSRVVLLTIGVYGVASRAYHFQVTWSTP